jgi:hypothetical protein
VAGISKTLNSNLQYPYCLTEVNIKQISRVSNKIRKEFVKLSKGKPFVIDKAPVNFQYLGIINLLFPDAIIIHCVRDARDTCLSCYFQNFVEEQEFSYDLFNAGVHYRQYERLVEHWKFVTKLKIFDSVYENLVDNFEQHVRDLLHHCKLPWEDNCLQFYKSKQSVQTASYMQVKSPIYKGSVGRWKHYEQYLLPLFEALEKYKN